MLVIVWILAGLALSILARAVAPERQTPPLLANSALGIVGGLVGGLVIDRLAQHSVAGFTAGFIGAIMGACVLLVVGNVVMESEDGSTRGR